MRKRPIPPLFSNFLTPITHTTIRRSGLAEDMDIIDPIGLHDARTAIKKKLARKFQVGVAELYDRLTKEMSGAPFEVNSKAVGKVRV